MKVFQVCDPSVSQCCCLVPSSPLTWKGPLSTLPSVKPLYKKGLTSGETFLCYPPPYCKSTVISGSKAVDHALHPSEMYMLSLNPGGLLSPKSNLHVGGFPSLTDSNALQ